MTPWIQDKNSNQLLDILACPRCRGELVSVEDHLQCVTCKRVYPINASGQLDFRLDEPVSVDLSFVIGQQENSFGAVDFSKLKYSPAVPDVLKNVSSPKHLSPELISHFPAASSAKSLMLDLGCGNGVHREIAELAGYTWVGLDSRAPEATMLGDGHLLPFHDQSFEFILSVAVMEHVSNPFVFTSEAYRVLKQKGTFIGTAAFLEPFHDNSHYHQSHLGVANTLRSAGFTVRNVSPVPDWHSLIPIVRKNLFPLMPLWLANSILFPLLTLHKIWWSLGSKLTGHPKAGEESRLLQANGAFSFIASRS